MIFRKSLLILLISVISACSSSRKVLPPQNLAIFPSNTPTEDDILAHEWSELYKEAQKNGPNEDSCAVLRILSKTPEFPLHWGALWRFVEQCPTPPAEEVKEIAKAIEDVPAYWRAPFARSLLRHYQLLDMRTEWIATLLTLTQLSSSKIEKENYLLTALNLAPEEQKLAILEDLQKISPRFVQDPDAKELLKVARDYEDAMEFEEARKLYDQIIKSEEYSFDIKNWAWERLALSEKKASGKEDYAKTLAKRGQWLAANLPSPESDNAIALLYEAQIEEARAWWTIEQNKKAKKILRPMLESYDSDHSSVKVKNILSNASWVMAMIYAEEKNHAQAQHYFDLTQKLYEENSIKNFDPLMSMSKYYYLRKKNEIAATLFTMATDSATEDYQRETAAFWRGLVLGESGQKAEAVSTLKFLGLNDRWGFYGHLARNVIKLIDPSDETLFPTLPNETPKPIDKEDHTPDAVLAWLGHLDEEELAELYLDANWKSPFEAMLKCRDVGLYHRTLHYYFKLPERKRMAYLEQDPSMAYPFPWREVIEAQAKRHGVPVALVLAIIRQESQFKPKARSPADAFGLMQLIPETAKRVARSLKMNLDKPEEQLYNPETNITLGVAYISELLREFDNSMPLAIASYNAGREAVKKWIKMRSQSIPSKSMLPQLVFSEAIPYKETKNYVAKVMRNFVNYCTLLEKRDCSPELLEQFRKKM